MVHSGTDGDVRAATADDLPLLAGIEAESDLVLTGALGAAPFAEVTDGLARDGVPGFILVMGRPAVGFVHVLEEDGQVHLDQLAVLPEHGRRGLGSALLEGACARAASSGYASITLTTFRDVPFNRPFYARRGFAVVQAPTGLLAVAVETERSLWVYGERVAMRRQLVTTPPRRGTRSGSDRSGS